MRTATSSSIRRGSIGIERQRARRAPTLLGHALESAKRVFSTPETFEISYVKLFRTPKRSKTPSRNAAAASPPPSGTPTSTTRPKRATRSPAHVHRDTRIQTPTTPHRRRDRRNRERFLPRRRRHDASAKRNLRLPLVVERFIFVAVVVVVGFLATERLDDTLLRISRRVIQIQPRQQRHARQVRKPIAREDGGVSPSKNSSSTSPNTSGHARPIAGNNASYSRRTNARRLTARSRSALPCKTSDLICPREQRHPLLQRWSAYARHRASSPIRVCCINANANVDVDVLSRGYS